MGTNVRLIDPDTGLPYRAGGGGTAASPSFTKTVGSTNAAPGQVTVTTAATLISAARVGRQTILITNLGTTDVFIGGAGVTTAAGQILPGTKGATLTLDTAAAVYGIVGTGTQVVSYTELY